MGKMVESEHYKNMLSKLKKTKKEEKEWKGVITLVDDTQMLWFLEKFYPTILQEFYEWREEQDKVVEDDT